MRISQGWGGDGVRSSPTNWPKVVLNGDVVQCEPGIGICRASDKSSMSSSVVSLLRVVLSFCQTVSYYLASNAPPLFGKNVSIPFAPFDRVSRFQKHPWHQEHHEMPARSWMILGQKRQISILETAATRENSPATWMVSNLLKPFILYTGIIISVLKRFIIKLATPLSPK